MSHCIDGMDQGVECGNGSSKDGRRAQPDLLGLLSASTICTIVQNSGNLSIIDNSKSSESSDKDPDLRTLYENVTANNG
jgi:hypothetical protein